MTYYLGHEIKYEIVGLLSNVINQNMKIVKDVNICQR